MRAWACASALLAIAGSAAAADLPAGTGAAPPIPSAQETHVITNPDWVRRPTAAEVSGVYPAKAYAENVSGRAWIACSVTAKGILTNCTVVDEDPPGYGFGAAALLLAPRLAMRPVLRDGVPIEGGMVRLPLIFNTFGPATQAAPKPDLWIANKAVWTAAPSAADVLAAYPKKAKAQGLQGHAVIRCRVLADGALSKCAIASEEPLDQGFGDAARSLAGHFKFVMATVDPAILPKLGVDVLVSFSPPDTAARTLAKADWLRTLPAEKVQEVFPAKAADAGLQTGRAVLDCVADPQGLMTGCQVVSEDPPGMDFGAAATRVAIAMGVNPWTEAGEPADGAHVKFALRLNRSADPPPAPNAGVAK